MGVALEKVKHLSPCIVGNPKESQQKDAKLRSCSLSLSYYTLLPRVHSTVCPTESQCCACRRERGKHGSAWTGCSWKLFIRQEPYLSSLPSFISFPPNSGPVSNEMGDEKVMETVKAGETAPALSSSRAGQTYLIHRLLIPTSNPIMVLLSIQICGFFFFCSQS